MIVPDTDSLQENTTTSALSGANSWEKCAALYIDVPAQTEGAGGALQRPNLGGRPGLQHRPLQRYIPRVSQNKVYPAFRQLAAEPEARNLAPAYCLQRGKSDLDAGPGHGAPEKPRPDCGATT